MPQTAILALEDGTVFWGKSIGSIGQTVGEVVFNTAMTGYQEILTDPSYCQQIVALTYPHIGNTGINIVDQESSNVYASGLIIRDLPLVYSNWRSEMSLDNYLSTNNIVAIANIDTRALTRHLRINGALKGCIMAYDSIDSNAAVQKAKEFPGLKNMDLARVVSTSKTYSFNQGSFDIENAAFNKSVSKFKVAVYDYGVKKNILRMLVDRGCQLTVYNAQTPLEELLENNPDGVFLSNGPGDPEPLTIAIATAKNILDSNKPLFGICLGHQVLALANGISTFKMHNGHRGINHPIKNLLTGKGEITSQNHGFAVDREQTEAHPDVEITHVHLNDNTVAGIRIKNKPVFSVQYHPEAGPGTSDATYLFDVFKENIINQ